MSTNYCDTCQISDCACICSICLNHQPLNQTPVKKNRKTNSKKINWISCNSCKLWAHPKCTGLTNKEFKVINNTELKKNNSSLFFKCLKCSIKAVTSAGLNLTASKNTPTLTQEISTQTISNTLESTISKSINSLNQITSNLTPPSKNSIPPVTSILASITQSPSSTEKNKISQSSNTSNKVIKTIDNIPKDLQTKNSNLI